MYKTIFFLLHFCLKSNLQSYALWNNVSEGINHIYLTDIKITTHFYI